MVSSEYLARWRSRSPKAVSTSSLRNENEHCKSRAITTTIVKGLSTDVNYKGRSSLRNVRDSGKKIKVSRQKNENILEPSGAGILRIVSLDWKWYFRVCHFRQNFTMIANAETQGSKLSWRKERFKLKLWGVCQRLMIRSPLQPMTKLRISVWDDILC